MLTLTTNPAVNVGDPAVVLNDSEMVLGPEVPTPNDVTGPLAADEYTYSATAAVATTPVSGVLVNTGGLKSTLTTAVVDAYPSI